MTTNEYPEDAKALWIRFKGREWIIMHSTGSFHAIASDEHFVSEKEVRNLFDYLVTEGFIGEDNNPNNEQPVNT